METWPSDIEQRRYRTVLTRMCPCKNANCYTRAYKARSGESASFIIIEHQGECDYGDVFKWRGDLKLIMRLKEFFGLDSVEGQAEIESYYDVRWAGRPEEKIRSVGRAADEIQPLGEWQIPGSAQWKRRQSRRRMRG